MDNAIISTSFLSTLQLIYAIVLGNISITIHFLNVENLTVLLFYL